MFSLPNLIDKARRLPDKKRYIEFFTAILTVPVLLTVIMLNLNNLKGSQATQLKPKMDDSKQVIVNVPSEKKVSGISDSAGLAPTIGVCDETIGPIEITYPKENEIVDENPVQFTISYDKEEHCTVVWSYRVNGGRWSEYDDKSIGLYNLPKGNIKFELRAKSIASGDEVMLERKFEYKGETTSDPSATATPSAN